MDLGRALGLLVAVVVVILLIWLVLNLLSGV
jgi:hypothetical protein